MLSTLSNFDVCVNVNLEKSFRDQPILALSASESRRRSGLDIRYRVPDWMHEFNLFHRALNQLFTTFRQCHDDGEPCLCVILFFTACRIAWGASLALSGLARRA